MRKVKYGDKVIEYDADALCIICGELVIGASMGGTVICGACDLGRCRYCGVSVMVYAEKYDDGKSKQEFRKHIEWHHINTPDIVKQKNDGMSIFLDKLEAKQYG